jgi:hypothetical protein
VDQRRSRAFRQLCFQAEPMQFLTGSSLRGRGSSHPAGNPGLCSG